PAQVVDGGGRVALLAHDLECGVEDAFASARTFGAVIRLVHVKKAYQLVGMDGKTCRGRNNSTGCTQTDPSRSPACRHGKSPSRWQFVLARSIRQFFHYSRIIRPDYEYGSMEG